MDAHGITCRRFGALSLVLFVATCVSACSGGGGGLGSLMTGTTSNPFSSSNSLDRTFIGAAQTWDLDKDSSVTCDEWKQYSTTALREADGDGDGALTADEYAVMARTDRLFTIADMKYYDANSDSKVSVDELSGKQNRAFNLLDKNSDCRIDRGESVQVVAIEKKKAVEGAPTDAQIERATGRR